MSMTPAQAQALIPAAYSSLHALQTGTLPVEIEHDGRRVRYARTDIDQLVAYIKTLEALANARAPVVGAIGVVF